MMLAQIPSETASVMAGSADKLDFLIVLIGFLVALSIGQLVNFFGDFLFHRRHGKASFTHGTFLIAIFLFQMFYWWELWRLKSQGLVVEEINFYFFIRLVLVPLCLFCATAVLCPRIDFPKDGEAPICMDEMFNDHCRPFYLFWIALCFIGILQGITIWNQPVSHPQIYIRAGAAVIFAIGMIFRNKILNRAIAAIMFALLLAYILVPVWVELIPG